MNLRLATPADDPGLVALMQRVAMPGSMRLSFGCQPSFFQALRVEGGDPVVVVAEEGGEIVGAGTATTRRAYLNGEVALLRYLSALRIDPRARRSTALARGYALLTRELSTRPAALTFTSILADNTPALAHLAAGRRSLPAYEPLHTCVTRIFPVARARRRSTDTRGIAVGSASAAEIAGFLLRHGPARNFFPVVGESDLAGADDSATPGLRAEDIAVARDGARIRGVLGCWNVMPRRQVLVAGYAPWLRAARPCLNAFARLTGRPALPPAGRPLRLAYGALGLVDDGDPAVFRALLDAALARAGQLGLDYFVLTLPEGDRLAAALSDLPRRELRSRIFRVRFGSSDNGPAPDGRSVHAEGAML